MALKAQVRKAVEELNEAKKPLLEMNAQRQQLMFDMRSKKGDNNIASIDAKHMASSHIAHV